MRIVSSVKLPIACSLALCWALTSAACYRPPTVTAPRPAPVDLSRTAYEALSERAGAVVVVEPRYGRVLKRISHAADVQFASSPFELAEIVTAYAALEAGIINEKTLFACDGSGAPADVVTALARPCPAFFAELSRRLQPSAFSRAADQIGFTYYGIETSDAGATTVRPITARIPELALGEAFTALATRGQGMEARDLHFAQLVSSLASGTTAAERFAAYITTTVRAPAPPAAPLNRQALQVVRRGLIKAVAEGEARSSVSIEHRVAGKMGSGEGQAVFISYAPAQEPQIGLVVYLKAGTGREAAAVAGRFYQSYFRK
jgi:cell division protein FtsI/penicillin-binding protein 2